MPISTEEYRFMREEEIRQQIKRYGFYHVISLTNNIQTPGIKAYVPFQRMPLETLKTMDLRGKRVLDIGCRDGLFSFEAERLGALEVIGIDNNLSRGAVEFLIPYFKSNVKMYELNLLDMTSDRFGVFDVVIFTGVLYHLRYPFWSLKIIANILNEGGQMLLETAVLLGGNRHAMLHCPTGSESPYEPSSCTFFNLKGLYDTLYSLGFQTERIEFLNSRIRRQWLKITDYLCLHFIRKRKRAIDRATLVCKKQSSIISTGLDAYWNRIHKRVKWP